MKRKRKEIAFLCVLGSEKQKKKKKEVLTATTVDNRSSYGAQLALNTQHKKEVEYPDY